MKWIQKDGIQFYSYAKLGMRIEKKIGPICFIRSRLLMVMPFSHSAPVII